jgi:NAD(P)-dependent dehydrogenase (short-subunit alcohol dehydrogenase family)
MTEIRNKTAIVTGAASGIGRALAVALAREGARLVLADLNQAGLAETARLVEADGGKADIYALDVSSREDVYAFADDVDAKFGGADIVINNAGVTQFSKIEDLSYEDLEWVMNIDFWGVVYGTKAFLPQLRRKGSGHIVNISSIFGIISAPAQGAYNAAKFAVRGFTEALRHEMRGSKIEVSCVHPGGVKTGIMRTARFLQHVTTDVREKTWTNFDKLPMMPPPEAAAIIVTGIRKNRQRIIVGNDARMMDWIQRLMPTSYGRIIFRPSRIESLAELVDK